ncbi:ankyrin repeat domain-containing protein [Candidatus Riflebacteria bacterium]
MQKKDKFPNYLFLLPLILIIFGIFFSRTVQEALFLRAIERHDIPSINNFLQRGYRPDDIPSNLTYYLFDRFCEPSIFYSIRPKISWRELNKDTNMPAFFLFAISWGCPLEIIKLFHEKGGRINRYGAHGYNAILEAAIGDTHFRILKYLVLNGARLNSKVKPRKKHWGSIHWEGAGPLHLSVLSNLPDEKKVKFLLKKGCDPNAKWQLSGENTPLHMVVDHDNSDIVKLLLDCGASPNSQDKSGQTPIFRYVAEPHSESSHVPEDFFILLQHPGLDLNIKDNDGNTVLHLAIKNSFATITKILINKGAKIEIKNNDGQTPMEMH